jgi:hypothetical protein
VKQLIVLAIALGLLCGLLGGVGQRSAEACQAFVSGTGKE